MKFLFTTLLCAFAAAPAIMALPSNPADLVARSGNAITANSALEARTFGHGHGGGRDHCQKSHGRRGDNCQCYPGLGCNNNYDKCECGDQGNAKFFLGGSDPTCQCSGDHQHYNKRERKCFCDEGYDSSYKQGKLQCKKPTCGENQHYNPHSRKCECDDKCEESWKNGKLVCKPKPTCGQYQHYNPWTRKCECDDKCDTSYDHGKLVCKPKPQCGEHQHYDKWQHKCVCDDKYDASWKHGKLVCIPCKPTPSKHHGHHHRALETGTPAPVEFRTVEDALGCSAVQTACQIDSVWTCFDSSSNLASCGGCPGEGVDCSSIDGVDEVRCAKGQCVIDSCQKGYTVDSTAGVCVSRGLFVQA